MSAVHNLAKEKSGRESGLHNPETMRTSLEATFKEKNTESVSFPPIKFLASLVASMNHLNGMFLRSTKHAEMSSKKRKH